MRIHKIEEANKKTLLTISIIINYHSSPTSLPNCTSSVWVSDSRTQQRYLLLSTGLCIHAMPSTYSKRMRSVPWWWGKPRKNIPLLAPGDPQDSTENNPFPSRWVNFSANTGFVLSSPDCQAAEYKMQDLGMYSWMRKQRGKEKNHHCSINALHHEAAPTLKSGASTSAVMRKKPRGSHRGCPAQRVRCWRGEMQRRERRKLLHG